MSFSLENMSFFSRALLECVTCLIISAFATGSRYYLEVTDSTLLVKNYQLLVVFTSYWSYLPVIGRDYQLLVVATSYW